jgi:peptidoglycan/LPS O-acetylase OafA/YrhL
VVTLERLPALDGLRAVAVYLVVVFHAGVARFEYGFIGVDVFFVLSGFLITKLLVIERVGSGRISLLDFYSRRIRRLLPAAWIAIAGTSVLYAAFASPLERASVLGDARAAVFYVANWNFIGNGQDYFAESLDSSPFLHLWSLAVEEQFYIVWPLIMIGVLALWTRSARAARLTSIGLCAVALVGATAAIAVAEANLLRAYYGTDTRAYQLLAGAAVAFALTAPSGRARQPLSARVAGACVGVGVAAIGGLAVGGALDPVERGVVVTVAAVVTLVGVAGTPSASLPARVLGLLPLRRLGDLSYATYLWHWPLVVVLDRTLAIGPVTTAIVVALLATGIAKLSMDLVERPVRAWSSGADRRRNVATVAVAAVATLALGLGVVVAVFESDRGQIRAVARIGFTPTVAPDATAGTTPVPDDVLEVSTEVPLPPATLDEPATPDAPATPRAPATPGGGGDAEVEGATLLGVDASVVGDSFDEGDGCVNDDVDEVSSCVLVRGSGERVLLIGDSHANKMNVIFAEHALANDLSLATVSMVACPWQRGVLYELVPPVEGARQVCRDQRRSLYERVVEEYQPDVVVAVSHDLTTERYTVVPSGDVDELVGLSSLELIDAATRGSIDSLVAAGARVVVLEPLPNAPFDIPFCLDAAEFVEECSFEVGAWPAAETPRYREIATSRDAVSTVDISDLVCPAFPRCDPIVDGALVRTDLDHLGLDFTRLIAPAVMERVGL